jgi:ribosomal protein S18 acetylase RimI-like enzyme
LKFKLIFIYLTEIAEITGITEMVEIVNINKKDILDIAYIGEQSLPIYYTAYHLLQILNNNLYIILKLTLEHDIIGFIILKQYTDNIHIMSIAILSSYRGNKYGSALLNYIKSAYPKYKFSLYVQTVNHNALRFYMNHGFKINKTITNYYDQLNDKDAHYCEYTEI